MTERVDFSYWWSCIGKALRLQPAQQPFLLVDLVKPDGCSNYLLAYIGVDMEGTSSTKLSVEGIGQLIVCSNK